MLTPSPRLIGGLLQLPFPGQTHFDHVVVVLQEALQLLAHGRHPREQALVPSLDLAHSLQVPCCGLQEGGQGSCNLLLLACAGMGA